MKVYIAGKITGDPDYLDKFQRAALKIRTEGHKVVSPTCLPDGLEWEDSRGARDEHRYALHTGKIVSYERLPGGIAV